MKKIIIALILLCLTGAASSFAQQGADINWANGYIIAVGQGTSTNRSDSKAKARLKATTAAKVNAQRNLLEVIKGVKITSQTTVQDSMLAEDNIKTRVEGVLKGAFIVGEPLVEMVDGSPVVTVTMKVCLNGTLTECSDKPTLTDALELDQTKLPEFVPQVILSDANVQQLAQTPPTAPKPQGWAPPVYDSTKPVTGLVVHLNGRYYERQLLPVVITNGQSEHVTVYSVKVVKPPVVRTYGAVRYADTIDQVRSNQTLGNNPMIVRAEAITKDNMILIRPDDARLIKETMCHGNDYLGDAKFSILVR